MPSLLILNFAMRKDGEQVALKFLYCLRTSLPSFDSSSNHFKCHWLFIESFLKTSLIRNFISLPSGFLKHSQSFEDNNIHNGNRVINWNRSVTFRSAEAGAHEALDHLEVIFLAGSDHGPGKVFITRLWPHPSLCFTCCSKWVLHLCPPLARKTLETA